MQTTTERPTESVRAAETGLAVQQRARQTALHDLARLRKEASAEIERLIAFLDQSDEYVMTEREPDGDELDASYPEGRYSAGQYPNEDDEPDADDEPSLGSSGHGAGGAITYMVHAISDGSEMVYDCEGDEHDGAEPENEGGEAVKEDDEPSLGWTDDEAARGRTYAGSMGTTADLEEGAGAVPPQNRTTFTGPLIRAQFAWMGRRRLCDLTPDQMERFRAAMRAGRGEGVGLS